MKVIKKKSEKEGWGLFATEDIKKGEIILKRNGKKIPSIILKILPRHIREHSYPISTKMHLLPSKALMYVNHSCKPNCGNFNLSDLIAIRDIKECEEITYDYSTISVEGWYMVCKCGENNCRGIIMDYKYLSPELKKKYSKIVPDWIKKKYD